MPYTIKEVSRASAHSLPDRRDRRRFSDRPKSLSIDRIPDVRQPHPRELVLLTA